MLLGTTRSNATNMSNLPYICDENQIHAMVREVTNLGEYYFIRKKGQDHFNAYRQVVSSAIINARPYYVQTYLPKHLYTSLIASGKVAKELYK